MRHLSGQRGLLAVAAVIAASSLDAVAASMTNLRSRSLKNGQGNGFGRGQGNGGQRPETDGAEEEIVGLYIEADIQYADHHEEPPIESIELADGTILDIDADDGADDEVKTRGWAKKRGYVSGDSEIILTGKVKDGKFRIKTPPGQAKKKNKRRLNMGNDLRRLKTGSYSVLALRVVAADASTTSSEIDISNEIFGTNGDVVNLKSQYAACSYNQLNFYPTTDNRVNNGVYTVTITNTVSGVSDGVIRNAVNSQATAELGDLPSQFDYVMQCLPPGTNGGWIAYAYINHWLSVYNNNWCNYPSGQMHELGHNLNLAHAGETSTYDDQSGMMGFSYSNDEGPVMCFNAPKTYQLGWFPDYHVDIEKTIPISPWTRTVDLVGQAERNNAIISQDYMIVRIYGFGDTDYYVSYNRKTGINSGSVEGGNRVLVHSRKAGIGYETSTLLAKLNSGGSHIVEDYDGYGADLTIIVNGITTGTPHRASVTITGGPQCTTDGDCNDENLCTTDVCTSGECVNTPITCADDGLFCNGSEVCDPIDGQCKSEGDPCTGLGGCGSLECNEITDTCDAPAPFVGETGQVALDDTIDTDGGSFFQNINFRHSYTKPVIVAFINTRGGSESIAPRIKDVTPTSFTLFMQEPDYQTHNAEGSVSYIVMEEGRHVLDGGLIVEAGLHTTSTVRSALDLDPSFMGDNISFGQAFASTPAVLHTLNTHNNDNKFMTSMATSVSSTGFQLAQERLEISDTLEAEENIGWIAFDTSAGTGETFCAPYTVGLIDPGFSVGVSDTPFVINYSSAGYSTSPDVVVSVISENEVDGSWARGSGLYSSTQQGVYAEEDQRGDAERNHASESFAWASFARNTDLIGTSITSAPTISSPPSEIPSNRPSTWPSSSPSTSPSSMPTPTCDDGGNVCEVGAFDFATRECIYEPLDCRDSNSCTNDMCDASEGGCKNTLIAGCTVGETGQVTLNATIATDDHAATVTFSKSYAKPIVVAFINTRNGGQSVVPRVKDVTGTSCKIFMEEPPIGNAGSTYSGHSESEDVSYMVVETGRHELAGGLIVEAGVHDTSRVRWKGQTFAGDAISFQSSFPEPPAVLHTLQTHNNGEFMTSLATTVTQNGFEIAQEALETGTQNRVVEETIGWIALTRGTGTTNNSPYIIDMKNDNAQNGVTQAAYIIDLSEAGFTTPGDVIVSLIGENGSDGSYARGSGTYTLTQQGVYAEEDQTNDSERNHASEPFAWAAFPRNTILRLPDLPSETPSSTPSATPSLSPSSGPSAESGAPSSVPSSSPTLASDSPSSVPSPSPSAGSDLPSLVPSPRPSAGSDSPSSVPSASPSTESDFPSSIPSSSPVITVSEPPSSVPSVSPSAGSDSPSLVPSPRPSAKSDSPSSAPSWSPVVVESDSPSPVPSSSPITTASKPPSSVPSASPSAESGAPSSVPSSTSLAPSSPPSSTPSSSPSDENSPTSIVGETGRRYLDDTVDRGHSQFVQFRHQYNDPIVVAFINSRRGGQSVSARIRSVNSSSFELFMQEPDNQNHADEHCSWMVMERGRHILEGGIVVEAGSLDTNNTHRGGYGFLSEDTNATDITFQVAFNERPAVLHSLMTHSNNDWMASLVTDVRNDGMKVALEAAESGKASPGGETIGFIAMSTGIGTNNGNPFHIGVANDYGKNGATDQGRDGVTDSPHVIEFGSTFANLAPAAPDVIVSLYGEGGTDGSWARGSGAWSATEQGVFAEEDQVKDSDRGHVDETFAWAAFPPNSEIIAAPAGSAAFGALSEILTPRCGDGLCEGNEAQTCPGDCVDYSSSAPPVGAPTTEAPFECARIESSTVCENNNECIWHRRKKTCCTPETGPGTTCSSSSECCSRVCRGNGTCL